MNPHTPEHNDMTHNEQSYLVLAVRGLEATTLHVEPLGGGFIPGARRYGDNLEDEVECIGRVSATDLENAHLIALAEFIGCPAGGVK